MHETYEPDKAVMISVGLETLHKLEKPLLSGGNFTKEDADQVAVSVSEQRPVFTNIKVVDGGTRCDYLYTASEETKVKGPEKDQQESEAIKLAAELAALKEDIKNILQPFLDQYNGLTNANSILV